MATNIIPAPTMSLQGFVTDLAGKLDNLLADFFTSDFNQTQLYPGTVVSFYELVQRVGGDAQKLIPLLQQAITTFLTPYYRTVQVEVQAQTPLDLDPSIRVELIMSIALSDVSGGVGAYQRLLVADDSKMSQIIKLNNEG